MEGEINQDEDLLMNPQEMEKDENINNDQENKTEEEKNNDENKEEEEKKEDNIEENEEIEEPFRNETEEIKIERLKGDYKKYDKSIKVMLIGDSGVGKSSILSRLINNTFTDEYTPSLSLEYNNHTIKINNVIIRMQI